MIAAALLLGLFIGAGLGWTAHAIASDLDAAIRSARHRDPKPDNRTKGAP